MPIPSMPPTKYRISAASSAPFVTKKSAATAPMWNAIIAMAVIQFHPF